MRRVNPPPPDIHQIPELGNSLTADKVVQFLSELFRRATVDTSTPQSREYMAGEVADGPGYSFLSFRCLMLP